MLTSSAYRCGSVPHGVGQQPGIHRPASASAFDQNDGVAMAASEAVLVQASAATSVHPVMKIRRSEPTVQSLARMS